VAALPARAAELQARVRDLEKRLRSGSASGVPRPKELAAKAEPVGDAAVLAWAGPFESAEVMKAQARDVRGILESGVIALGLEADEPQLFVTVSPDLVARGVTAGAIVQAAAPAIDGRGGGRPEMAQANGSRRDGLADAMEAVRAAVARALDAAEGAAVHESRDGGRPKGAS
jgi:alanyl-tRNA synthetase